MKVYGHVFGALGQVPGRARAVEASGYDGAVAAEIHSDPFLPLALAAEHTSRVELLTAIAVAFARSPMTVAQIGRDLNEFSRGRLVLGLGSQIRAHVERRFSMPWSKPAARMREFVLALRAIWASWYEGAPLDFRGEFYSHTLMTPMFVPPEREHGPPRVMLAGVGPRMTEAAGEVADGLIAHAFTTRRYLREVTLPALARGLAKAGRPRERFELACPAFVVTGETPEAFEASRRALRQQLAFYASTPAYRGVLALHGWEALGRELTELSKRGRWVEMGERVPDEVLHEFAVVEEPAKLADALRARYAGLVDAWIATWEPSDEGARRAFVGALRV
jgi:probable F420-dependent oxidoreductase